MSLDTMQPRSPLHTRYDRTTAAGNIYTRYKTVERLIEREDISRT